MSSALKKILSQFNVQVALLADFDEEKVFAQTDTSALQIAITTLNTEMVDVFDRVDALELDQHIEDAINSLKLAFDAYKYLTTPAVANAAAAVADQALAVVAAQAALAQLAAALAEVTALVGALATTVAGMAASIAALDSLVAAFLAIAAVGGTLLGVATLLGALKTSSDTCTTDISTLVTQMTTQITTSASLLTRLDTLELQMGSANTNIGNLIPNGIAYNNSINTLTAQMSVVNHTLESNNRTLVAMDYALMGKMTIANSYDKWQVNDMVNALEIQTAGQQTTINAAIAVNTTQIATLNTQIATVPSQSTVDRITAGLIVLNQLTRGPALKFRFQTVPDKMSGPNFFSGASMVTSQVGFIVTMPSANDFTNYTNLPTFNSTPSTFFGQSGAHSTYTLGYPAHVHFDMTRFKTYINATDSIYYALGLGAEIAARALANKFKFRVQINARDAFINNTFRTYLWLGTRSTLVRDGVVTATTNTALITTGTEPQTLDLAIAYDGSLVTCTTTTPWISLDYYSTHWAYFGIDPMTGSGFANPKQNYTFTIYFAYFG